MTVDRRGALIEDIIEGLVHGDVAEAASIKIERMDDGTVLQVDLGEPDFVYIVTVSSHERTE